MESSIKNMLFAVAFTTAVVALQGSTAFAVLGETEAELIKRYGKPDAVLNEDVAPAEKLIAWVNHPNFEQVIVCLINGESVREVFQLKQPVNDRQDKTVCRILEDNADGEKWQPLADEQMPGYNTLQRMKGAPALKYVWVRKSNDWKAFVLHDDPRHFEVNSSVWHEALSK
jgi:hypothetical protein